VRLDWAFLQLLILTECAEFGLAIAFLIASVPALAQDSRKTVRARRKRGRRRR
jgi:hypothetical protein